MDKKEKTAIITGGSRGIGYGIAKQLGADGFSIAILDINAFADYRSNFDALEKAGVDYLYMQGSITEKGDREAFLEKTLAKYGRVDVLVNNAGVAPKVRQDLLEMTEESFDFVVGTNLKGTMFMSQLVARQMLKQEIRGQKRGIIVNITSSSVTVSSVNRAEYCMSKAGLAILTQVYADRLAKDRVFIYEIRPGVIDTDMTRVVHKKYSDLIEAGVFPVARWGYPEDIGLAVSAFCGDKFLYTTGNYIDVDGGFHIKRL
ncbi:MAG: 3-ketoacyl-ACP reductase [Spirochaetales bacterium]|jgi:NAD(P)-dependent dehydrogenase (short-subunit alcohol dehydrogenase family)|nr:3-ketoacyl-ACP reductase [Spirochaetales bacterium]